jgi:hypothetical protein
MLFMAFFMVGALILPLTIDISKNGRDNILVKSGRDILEFPLVRNFTRSVKTAQGRATDSFVALGSFSVALFALFLLYVLLRVIGFLIGFLWHAVFHSS